MFYTPEQGLQQEPSQQEFPEQEENTMRIPEATPVRRSNRERRPPQWYGERAM